MQSHCYGSEHLLESQEDQEDLKNHFQDTVQDEVPGRVCMKWFQLINWKTMIRVSYIHRERLLLSIHVFSVQMH